MLVILVDWRVVRDRSWWRGGTGTGRTAPRRADTSLGGRPARRRCRLARLICGCGGGRRLATCSRLLVPVFPRSFFASPPCPAVGGGVLRRWCVDRQRWRGSSPTDAGGASCRPIVAAKTGSHLDDNSDAASMLWRRSCLWRHSIIHPLRVKIPPANRSRHWRGVACFCPQQKVVTSYLQITVLWTLPPAWEIPTSRKNYCEPFSDETSSLKLRIP